MASKARQLFYIVEHRWDGYNQRFSKMDRWRDVLKWARDGSIQDGEHVMAVYAIKKQPRKKQHGGADGE